MEDHFMRQLDGQRRLFGRPTLNARTALSESMADIDSPPATLNEARGVWQSSEALHTGQAGTLGTSGIEREIDPGPT
ncbi:MAG: hypothetical protein KIT37_13530 [Steroidobacteraceae bacterium]|nr:hypothetical protein [Steroidobacteraceae bacterium]